MRHVSYLVFLGVDVFGFIEGVENDGFLQSRQFCIGVLSSATFCNARYCEIARFFF